VKFAIKTEAYDVVYDVFALFSALRIFSMRVCMPFGDFWYW
jgi:hypothetical protein